MCMDVLVHVSMHVVFSTMSMYVVKTIEDRLRAAALTRNPKILVYFLKIFITLNIFRTVSMYVVQTVV